MLAKCQAPSQFIRRSSCVVDEMGRDNSCPPRVRPGGSEQQEFPQYNSEEIGEGVKKFTFLPDLSLLFLDAGVGLSDSEALWFCF